MGIVWGAPTGRWGSSSAWRLPAFTVPRISGRSGRSPQLTGSYAGTASEYLRYRWKARHENQRHLYVERLFRYCRHSSYFVDLILFFGFALLARQLWAGMVPLAMGLNFVLVIIPVHASFFSCGRHITRDGKDVYTGSLRVQEKPAR